jgi:hypothetical protein
MEMPPMHRFRKPLLTLAAASTAGLALLCAGCQNDRSASSSSDGRVVSETHRQDVTPGGTEVQTRTQVRETPGGQRVRETEMRTREDVTAQPNTGNR